MTHSVEERCPCGTGLGYKQCCGQYIEGSAVAPTAEALMRSRYSAFVMKDTDYLIKTWHSESCPERAELEDAGDKPATWLGLKIIGSESGQAGDETGVVEFVARYKVNGRAVRIHEVSRFVFEQGQWFYVDGDLKRK